jgi:hypothetical protein
VVITSSCREYLIVEKAVLVAFFVALVALGVLGLCAIGRVSLAIRRRDNFVRQLFLYWPFENRLLYKILARTHHLRELKAVIALS